MKHTQPNPSSFFLSAAVLVISLAFAVLSGCANPAASPASGAADTGSLTVSMPSMAAWIQSLESAASGRQASGRSTSRAFAYTTSIKIEVLDSANNAVVQPHVFTPVYVAGISGTVGQIPAGTGYTIKVSVYNTNASATDPVVMGQAAGVSITAGQNAAVSVHCLPVNPTLLAVDGGPVSANLNYHGEKWYAFSVVSGTHYYFSENFSGFVMGLFSNTGAFIVSHYSYIDYLADYTGIVYLCLLGQLETGAGSVTIGTTVPVLNEGSTTIPVDITPNSTHTFLTGLSGSNDTSYYRFMTGAAGSYALDLPHGMYSVTLYSDSAFSSVVSGPSSVAKGKVFTGMSAGTSYFLKLTNLSTYDILSATGFIADPSTISGDTTHEGIIGGPVGLSVGSSWGGKVGGRVYSNSSYYQIMTGGESFYRFSMSNWSPSGMLQIRIFTDSAFTVGVDSAYFSDFLTTAYKLLAPSTTYYLQVVNYSDHAVAYDLNISTHTPTILPSDGSWKSGNLAGVGGIVVYEAAVNGGQTYKLNWDDLSEGSGTYTLDAAVSAYQENVSTMYFSYQDSGYSTGKTITVPSGQTKLYINVEAHGYTTTGTFALKLQQQ